MTDQKEIIEHAGRGHALCSASGAERWMNCPGSLSVIRECPIKPSSSYALEGTHAHEISERFLSAWQNNEANPEIEDKEMLPFINLYIDFVKKKYAEFNEKPTIRIESKLTLNPDLDMYGTADVAMTGNHVYGMHGKIIDLKYGKTKVIAKDNLQLAYYAAALVITSRKKLETVEVSIVQPRIKNPITTVNYKRAELLEWHKRFSTAAEAAYMQITSPTKREFNMGTWCKYCDGKSKCPKFNQSMPSEALEFL